MSSFQERLLRELVTEHAAQLAQPPVASARRRRRRLPLAAAASAACAGAIALLLGPGGGGTTPAYAVTVGSGGAVTITISELAGVVGADQQLQKLGVRAVVAEVRQGCSEEGERVPFGDYASQLSRIVQRNAPADAGSGGSWTVSPSEIPAGDTLSIVVTSYEGGSQGHSGLNVALYRGAAPACEPPSEISAG